MIHFTDIENLANRDDYLGYGYLGHSSRNHYSDTYLAEAANDQGIDLEDVFLWANSKCGRWFLDTHGQAIEGEELFPAMMAHDMQENLPELRRLKAEEQGVF